MCRSVWFSRQSRCNWFSRSNWFRWSHWSNGRAWSYRRHWSDWLARPNRPHRVYRLCGWPWVTWSDRTYWFPGT